MTSYVANLSFDNPNRKSGLPASAKAPAPLFRMDSAQSRLPSLGNRLNPRLGNKPIFFTRKRALSSAKQRNACTRQRNGMNRMVSDPKWLKQCFCQQAYSYDKSEEER
ncbi:sensor histidine kinase [Striga asiatica]|uniref:Sensor histidine kinase n=1 Tax=Striga asiatica TaxID=4170 RepID=A0A5A7QNU9_STRAF|nr:sensor histidine kinase [Striga asiatica]